MKRPFWTAILLFTLVWFEAAGQVKSWTLEECINYAVTNNIGLKRQRLQTETSQANLLKSRMDVLPSLNFGSDAPRRIRKVDRPGH